MSGFLVTVGPGFKTFLKLLGIGEKIAKKRGIKKDENIEDTYVDTLDDLDDILPK